MLRGTICVQGFNGWLLQRYHEAKALSYCYLLFLHFSLTASRSPATNKSAKRSGRCWLGKRGGFGNGSYWRICKCETTFGWTNNAAIRRRMSTWGAHGKIDELPLVVPGLLLAVGKKHTLGNEWQRWDWSTLY